jgi:phosphatidylserine decarboxylase
MADAGRDPQTAHSQCPSFVGETLFCFAPRWRHLLPVTMSAEPIRFFNRTTRALETEEIYGERWLRFAYEHPVGRFFTWALIRRRAVSAYYGWRMNRLYSASKVLPFIIRYNIDVKDFAKSPLTYNSFNEFFHRALKPEARPIAPGENVVVFPADGRHLVFPNVDETPGFYVKGATFSLRELFGDSALASEFAGGAMTISRLCPVDYHRFHFPVAGVPDEARLINGCLYSVSPIALRRNVRYLVENKRMVTCIESADFGKVAMIEVGATMVGTIAQLYADGRPVAKGEEKGWFKFGGSCVITVFQRGRLRFDDDLVEQSARHIECYAKMGERMGVRP